MSGRAFFTGPASSGIVASPQVLAQGAGFFAQSCADCHGDDAHGDEGPDLHSLAISNARIAAQIKNGTKGEMPSFAKKYDDRQIAALIVYLRSLR
jgi:mono/diheme cytochrome c family protein